jgi:hypothetical protein
MKTKAVYFENGYARVLTNPNKDELALPGILVNPDFTEVQGLPPEMWKREGDALAPHSEEEQAVRRAERHGPACPTRTQVILHVEKYYKVPAWAYAVMVVEAAVAAAALLIK